MHEMDEKFQNFKDILKKSLTNISYTTWFSKLELYDITDNTLIIKSDSENESIKNSNNVSVSL